MDILRQFGIILALAFVGEILHALLPLPIPASIYGILLLFAKLFHFDHASYVTLLPKSITTAIGMGVSEELGGYVSITVVAIIATGVVGNIFAEQICSLFHITDPVAKGIACGSAAHAMGTSKAMEMGAVEGAMSSLAMVAAGIMTVAGASLFAVLM